MSRWVGISLRSRLTLLIALILLVAVIAQAATAYAVAKREILAVTRVRLQTAALRLAELAAPGTRARRVDVARVARDPALLGALAGADPAAARPILAQLGPDTGLLVSVELRNRDRKPVAFLTRTASPSPRPPEVSDTGWVSPLYQRGDTVLFEVGAPVRGGEGIDGSLVQTRRLSSSPNAISVLTNLIGPGGAVLLGNSDGSLWTDLMTTVDRPPPSFEGSHYPRAGERRLAVSAPVAGTPFVFAAELPEDRALAALDPMLRTDISIAILVLLLGTGVAWATARTITRPLTSLTRVTEGVAAGQEVEVPLAADRRDEIGRLARSFTTMAERVKESREHLEQRVADRTRELAATVEQLRDAQEELVRKERLATLGQLSSSVGHELRNPLGVMTNAVYYLTATQPDAPPKVTEYLGIIRTQIHTAEKIVADLLDFARIKAPERTRVDVPAFLEEQLARVALPPTVEVVRELDPDLPPLHVDPVQVGQVMLNLVTNAVQAMEDRGGTLTIRARRDDGRVRIEVEDQGAGISPEHFAKIFEPLFTTKARGIGLGLSVSLALARVNGGSLSARNVAGAGAVFALVLPGSAAA